MITKEQLRFSPLAHASWIDNAVVPINNHFRLSISKNGSRGLWHVGEDDSYEVAIQAFEHEGGKGDLVWVENDTVTSRCNIADINKLAGVAAKLVYVGKIEVFDIGTLAGGPGGQPHWFPRFYCAQGKDLTQKLQYSYRVWGSKNHRFIPAH